MNSRLICSVTKADLEPLTVRVLGSHPHGAAEPERVWRSFYVCLLYTSDAADE